MWAHKGKKTLSGINEVACAAKPIKEKVNLYFYQHKFFFFPPWQQFSRSNNSVQANSLKDLLQSKIDDLEKQVLSRVNSIEEGKPGLRNETEQRGRVESTLTSLHQRITDLEKGSREEMI